jgi:hypothetical protein
MRRSHEVSCIIRRPAAGKARPFSDWQESMHHYGPKTTLTAGTTNGGAV